jgi:hypothetical protein
MEGFMRVLLILLFPLFAYPYGDVLRMSQGGTGNSTFASGGMCFSDGTKLTTDAANIFWNNTSKRLGIGTASPATQLEINGVTRSSGYSLSGTGVTGGTTAFAAGTISTDSNWGMYFRAPTASSTLAAYSFRNIADTELMRIDSTGNVGIGKTPTTKLDVNGTISATSFAGPGSVPIGSIIAWSGGYFTNGANAGFTNVLGNTVANVNTYLSGSGWIVCDGAALNDVSSPIWNAASRFLPNLTDSRFLMGSTAGGGIGGQTSTTIASGNLPVHAHDMAHTHGAFTSGGMSANTTHSHGINDPGHSHTQSVDASYNAAAGGLAGRYAGNNTGANLAQVPMVTGTTGTGITVNTSANLDHTHTTTIGAYAGSTGNGGFANTAIENRPLYLSVFYIVRYK